MCVAVLAVGDAAFLHARSVRICSTRRIRVQEDGILILRREIDKSPILVYLGRRVMLNYFSMFDNSKKKLYTFISNVFIGKHIIRCLN